MKNSILFIVFNRPHQTRIVFDEIKKYKPNRLYVSADGPRELFVDDKEKCLKVMEVVNDVDWQCELKILKHDVNLGCKIAASTAVKWFFENEEQGIVLEDDTVPVQSFFLYCDEMLKRYENHKEVAFISGSNLITSEYNAGVSYFFSKHSMMWGWAS